MNDYESSHALRIDLVYANGSHPENIFKEDIYCQDAKFWLHKDLAEIVLQAAELASSMSRILVLKDGLRPTDAQEKMAQTKVVRANPHWLVPPRMLSPPGLGGHPRGMAVDLTVADKNGKELDFGTVFDALPPEGAKNPAARDYMDFPAEILENREYLEGIMVEAAGICGREIVPLPNEWWDFRLPDTVFNDYAPLSEKDFPFQVTA